jgi:hypothetical protein
MQLLARGAFLINLQQTAMAALARREFPVKTPNEPDRWNWVHCQIRPPRNRQPIELIMPDMAGEALLEEIEHPHTYTVIRSFLTKCAGVMILVDAGQLESAGRDQDYVTMKLLSYLTELDEDPKTGWRNRPIALILSKADQCEACFDDPADYARRHAEGLWQHCGEQFRDFKFFASGVAGACAYRQAHREDRRRIPLRIEPRGIVEPFERRLLGVLEQDVRMPPARRQPRDRAIQPRRIQLVPSKRLASRVVPDRAGVLHGEHDRIRIGLLRDQARDRGKPPFLIANKEHAVR